MVFKGKPSDGCSECRRRKMGCDLGKPDCGQCIRGRRPCPGYRDQLETMFLNETEKVVRKGLARESARQKLREKAVKKTTHASTSSSSSSSSADSEAGVRLSRSASPSRVLHPNIEECAMSYFFQNFGQVKRISGYSYGYLSFLSGLGPNDLSTAPLNTVIQAVGLAGLSIIGRDEKARKRALSHYTNALTVTNELLRCPETATLDTTLASIILLGMFEYVTCSTPSAMLSWTKHLYGATTLLDMRGSHQFNSRLGIFMFLYMRSQVIMNCFQRHVPVPQELINWGDYVKSLGFFDNWPANSMVETFVDFAQLRAALKAEIITEPVDILDQLVKLDDRFQSWRDTLPEEWHFSEHTLDRETEEVLGLRYHTYTDNWIAAIWTNYRLGHFIACEMITHYLTSFSSKPTPLGPISNPKLRYEQAKISMSRLMAEMAASVPFQLGFKSHKDRSTSAAMPYAQGGLACLWPLCIIASVETAPAVVRNWAINRLHFVGSTMGIQPALAISTILRTRQQIRNMDAWITGQGGDYRARWIEIGRFSVFKGKPETLFEEGSHNWMSETDFEIIRSGKVRLDYL